MTSKPIRRVLLVYAAALFKRFYGVLPWEKQGKIQPPSDPTLEWDDTCQQTAIAWLREADNFGDYLPERDGTGFNRDAIDAHWREKREEVARLVVSTTNLRAKEGHGQAIGYGFIEFPLIFYVIAYCLGVTPKDLDELFPVDLDGPDFKTYIKRGGQAFLKYGLFNSDFCQALDSLGLLGRADAVVVTEKDETDIDRCLNLYKSLYHDRSDLYPFVSRWNTPKEIEDLWKKNVEFMREGEAFGRDSKTLLLLQRIGANPIGIFYGDGNKNLLMVWYVVVPPVADYVKNLCPSRQMVRNFAKPFIPFARTTKTLTFECDLPEANPTKEVEALNIKHHTKAIRSKLLYFKECFAAAMDGEEFWIGAADMKYYSLMIGEIVGGVRRGEVYEYQLCLARRGRFPSEGLTKADMSRVISEVIDLYREDVEGWDDKLDGLRDYMISKLPDRTQIITAENLRDAEPTGVMGVPYDVFAHRF